MGNVDMEKKLLRKEMLKKRDSIAPPNLLSWSDKIVSFVVSGSKYVRATDILLYSSYGSEVITKMDFNEFKEQFTEDVKQELADAGIDAKVSINTVEKMNESYEAMTVTPEGSNVGVNVNMEKFFWGSFIFYQIAKRGLNATTAGKTFVFSLYWHFLDVVWIFIFSFIYLKGMM